MDADPLPETVRVIVSALQICNHTNDFLTMLQARRFNKLFSYRLYDQRQTTTCESAISHLATERIGAPDGGATTFWGLHLANVAHRLTEVRGPIDWFGNLGDSLGQQIGGRGEVPAN